jgi:hypothetical protein
MRSPADGDYSWQPFWTPVNANPVYNFQPIPGGVPTSHDTEKDCDHFVSGTFVTADSTIGCTKHWYAPLTQVSFVVERWDIYSMTTDAHADVRLGEWIDYDVPTDVHSNNNGGFDFAEDYVWQRGIDDPGEDPVGCTPSENRYGASGLLGYYYDSEAAIDPGVNHTGLYGGFVLQDASVFASGTDSLAPDSVWSYLNRNEFLVDAGEVDKQVVLSFGSFEVRPDDTLHIWVVHASEYDGGLSLIDATIADAKTYYSDVLRPPEAICGDADGSGAVGLYDAIYLIDYLYKGGPAPDPSWVGDVDLCDGITVSDAQYLIDYIFHDGPLPCAGVINCDYAPEGDTVEAWVVSGTGQSVWMDLFVRNGRTSVGGSLGFSWQDPDLRLDSAKAYSFVNNGFDMGVYFYEDDSLSVSNANQRFLFGAGKLEETGVPGDSTRRRAWVRYYFTQTGKSAKDDPLIDTTTFNEGTKYLMVEEDSLGYSPVWGGALFRAQCCGIYAGGYTGNVDCDPEGRRNLADITRLTSRVYLTPEVPLCCEENGNTNGDPEGVMNLADITRLIDHVYVSYAETVPCP